MKIFIILSFFLVEIDAGGAPKMDEQGVLYPVLVPGQVYWDKKHNQKVEFGYMGQTGFAIVCEPGDFEGGMQSSWGVDPGNLEKIASENCKK